MKKIWISLLIFSCAFALSAAEIFKIGPYAGYFASRENLLTNVYKGEDLIYGVKTGVRVWNQLHIWFSALHFTQDGETVPLGDPTRLTLTPLNLSLRYNFPLGTFRPYLGGGYSYIYYKENSDIGDIKGEGKGYSLDLGVEMRLSARFHLDIGIRYTDVKVNPRGFDAQIGGLQGGLTLLLVI